VTAIIAVKRWTRRMGWLTFARRGAGQKNQKIILNTPVTTSSPIRNIIKMTHNNIFIPFSCVCMSTVSVAGNL
jgi:hypothetical protein